MTVSVGLPTDSRAYMLPGITLGALRLTDGKVQPALFDLELLSCWLHLLPFCHFALALSPVAVLRAMEYLW